MEKLDRDLTGPLSEEDEAKKRDREMGAQNGERAGEGGSTG